MARANDSEEGAHDGSDHPSHGRIDLTAGARGGGGVASGGRAGSHDQGPVNRKHRVDPGRGRTPRRRATRSRSRPAPTPASASTSNKDGITITGPRTAVIDASQDRFGITVGQQNADRRPAPARRLRRPEPGLRRARLHARRPDDPRRGVHGHLHDVRRRLPRHRRDATSTTTSTRSSRAAHATA